MSETEIKVPNIGDFRDVEVIEVLISEGQILKKNDPLITIESDKSSVEIPSNFDGKIKTLKIKVGDKVSEGDLILVLENTSQTHEKTQKKQIIEKESKKIQVIKPEIQQTVTNKNKITDISSASPKARKFARELGVDINQVKGSERKGRVVESDIKLFVASKSKNILSKENKINEKIEQEYSHSEFGEIEIKEIPRVKKLSSKYLMNSWTNIPHVTNHDEADITELEEFRTSLTDIYTGEKKKITPLAFIVKALTASLKKFPNFNNPICRKSLAKYLQYNFVPSPLCIYKNISKLNPGSIVEINILSDSYNCTQQRRFWQINKNVNSEHILKNNEETIFNYCHIYFNCYLFSEY